MFANSIWPAYSSFVKEAGGIPRDQLAGRAELRLLDQDLRKLMKGLDVVKVKIYDLDGLTVFSSDPRQVGEDKSKNPGYQGARSGEAKSEVTFRDRFDAWEGTLSDRNIVASYVPVRATDEAQVEAVMEVYSDVTRMVDRMNASQGRVLLEVIVAMSACYLAGLAILRRYDRVLREKETLRLADEQRNVEEAHQAEFMRARYCTELQGFLFSRPLPAEELPGMVARIQRGSELRAA